jgi:hypothetical protein
MLLCTRRRCGSRPRGSLSTCKHQHPTHLYIPAYNTAGDSGVVASMIRLPENIPHSMHCIHWQWLEAQRRAQHEVVKRQCSGMACS